MRNRHFLALVLLLLCDGVCQSNSHTAPEIVVVPSGNLRLKAYFWRSSASVSSPAVLFVHGSGGTDSAHTGGFTMAKTAEILAPIFIKHGYAFLYLCRRGQGLSEDQAPFMQDVLRHEKANRGEEASKRLQFVLLTTDHLDDVMAGLSFLKSLPGVDAHRIALVGHSFGGQLVLLAAERDSTVRAAVTFSAAAGSWKGSSELGERLLAAVRKTTVPIMLLDAANDYSAPGKVMAEELGKRGKPHVLKIYPPVGRTADDGHNFLYTAVAQWETDVFSFLDQYARH